MPRSGPSPGVSLAARQLPAGIATVRVLDEPVQLLTGPAHPLAGQGSLTPAQLAGLPIWMPALDPGTEWTAFYADLAAAFGLSLDVTGPDFGTRPLLDVIAGSPDLASLVGEQTHLVWPADWDLRRIPLRDPVPVYPHSLIWRRDNPHPALRALREHLAAGRPGPPGRRQLGPGLGPAEPEHQDLRKNKTAMTTGREPRWAAGPVIMAKRSVAQGGHGAGARSPASG